MRCCGERVIKDQKLVYAGGTEVFEIRFEFGDSRDKTIESYRYTIMELSLDETSHSKFRGFSLYHIPESFVLTIQAFRNTVDFDKKTNVSGVGVL